MMTRLLTVLAAGTAMLAVSAAANATTTATQTVTFGPGLTDYSNNTGSGTFNLFDSNLGTLQSFTISGTYGFNSTITVSNNGGSSSTGSVRTESASQFGSSTGSINTIIQNLLDQAGSASIGSQTLNPVAFDLLGTTQNYSLAAGTSTQLVSSKSTQSDGPLTDTSASDLAAFSAAGGGTFAAQFNTLTGTLLSNNGGNTSASQSTTATGTISLYYTYAAAPPVTTVPEPTSLAILGAGLVGAGLLRRRRA